MITIKACTIEDVDALRDISIETFTDTFEAENDPEHLAAYLERAYNMPQLECELSNPDSQFFFAYVDGRVAGYLKVNAKDAQTEVMGDEVFELERIYVRRAFQGSGVGKALYDRAVSCARELDKREIWLGVWEHNHKALAFYKKHGFVQTGAHTFYMGDDAQADLIMAKRLRP
ncbi:GNAT family N-acetyltransferase [Exiguobacterium sp. SH4S7]|uniref:GNAT family N-acetyltransferase n=1 Tax=Exiguobacterium sp. SH4S7 TaxID=2510958 RepID=UPI00103C81A6|nr:GNAT family N-acetyltransferase [Exiguobacterium sp. SH4S7]TCI36270.1 GNAT family N-acetyltransferase [Exiguobacterium sp. SH4S7]